MKSNTTNIWFVVAIILAAAVWFVGRHFQPAPALDNALLAGLRATDVTAIQITPIGEREISVIRTNKNWLLNRPVAYPAQTAAIESLLAALEKLSPLLRLTPAEMSHKNADAEFGFENPQFRVDIDAGDQSWHLNIGNKTAPGDGVYVRIVGGAGSYVTDVKWLETLPHDFNAWRNASLIDDVASIDWLVITNGAKAIELRRDATNRIWRMIRPLSARADGPYITTALQQLRSAKARSFVTDDPKADLVAFGLQPAELDIWMGHGTNFTSVIHAGKESADKPGQVFARRDAWNSVVTILKDDLVPWRGDENNFRDPHLLSFPTPPIAEIEVRDALGDFSLRQQGSNQWVVAGEKFPMDMENLQLLVRILADLRVTEFVKNVATGPDLQSFGLAPTNSRTITLRSIPGDTNAVIAQLIFGATDGTNRVFVKRADEDFVYALALRDVNQLPDYGWRFRDRHIWTFSETNLAQITLHQEGRTLQVIHNGFNKWSIAPGSQGQVDSVGLEETAKQFGNLNAVWWQDRNFSPADGEKNYGFSTNKLSINFELKTGEKYTVDMGRDLQSQTAFAAVTLDGDRWAFALPGTLYALLSAYLNIPPGPP